MTITRIPISLVFLALTLFSAVTHAQAVKEVIIINDAINPVPVTTNGFVRTPFSIQLDGQLSTPTEGECVTSFDVDDNQLLVIEGFSVDSTVVSGADAITKTTAVVVTNGVAVNHFLSAGTDSTGKSASHQVRLYADPGSTVGFLVTHLGGVAFPCTFGVSGYLIDPSSPSLAP